MLTHEPTEHDVLLAEIVKATKGQYGYCFQTAVTLAPLISLGLVETSSEIAVPSNLPGMIATRATPDGIKHIVLRDWEVAKATLSEAKERELALRNEVVKLFSDPEKLKGTQNVQLDDGAKLKIVKKLNYGFVKTDADGNQLENWIDNVDAALDAIESLGPQYKLVADRLVKWSADLSVSEYNKLDELGEDGKKIKAAIDKVIEVKEGTPTVELVEPKAKK